MSDEVKLLPCDREALNDRIKQLRAERKRYFDCEGDGVDVLLIDIQNYFAREATRPPIGTDEVVEAAYREAWHEGYATGDAGGSYQAVENDWLASDARAALHQEATAP